MPTPYEWREHMDADEAAEAREDILADICDELDGEPGERVLPAGLPARIVSAHAARRRR